MDLIFPARCWFCHAVLVNPKEAICPDCLAGVHYLQSPLCSCCGRELPASSGGDHLCGACLRQPPVYARARAAVRYEAPVSHLLHRLKYVADTRTMPALLQVLRPFAERVRADFQHETDRIVPVPLFSSRLKRRGLNQSLLLARIVFPEAGEALLFDALIRVRDTRPQTTLDGEARRKNLRSAFALRHPEAVRGRRIFLIDDVFTTGTTVIECSKALLAAGAGEVQVVTAARVAEHR